MDGHSVLLSYSKQRKKEEKEANRRDPRYQFLAAVASGVRHGQMHGHDRPYYDFEDR